MRCFAIINGIKMILSLLLNIFDYNLLHILVLFSLNPVMHISIWIFPLKNYPLDDNNYFNFERECPCEYDTTYSIVI